MLYVVDVTETLRRSGDRPTEPLCSRRTAFVLGTVLGGLAFVVLVKGVFSLPRTDPSLHAVSSSEHGFPSGHVMAAVVFWGAVALWWSTVGDRFRRLLAAGLVVATVGFARLALGIHYLVDVPVSIAFGVGYLAAFAWFARGNPSRAFAAAIGIAVLAVVVDAGSSRALLALVGTVGGAVGWWSVERPIARRRIVAAARRFQPA